MKTGEVIELKCTYDPETKSGSGFTGRKVKGTIHWVSASEGEQVEVHMLNPLLKDEEGFDADTFLDKINPDSLKKDHRLGRTACAGSQPL